MTGSIFCMVLAGVFRVVSIGAFTIAFLFALRSHVFLVQCDDFNCKEKLYKVHNAVVPSTIAMIFAFITWVLILVEIVIVSTLLLRVRCCRGNSASKTRQDLLEQSTIWLNVCTGVVAFIAGGLEAAAYQMAKSGGNTYSDDRLIATILFCSSLLLFSISGVTTYCAGFTKGPESSDAVQQDPEANSPSKDEAEANNAEQDPQTPNTEDSHGAKRNTKT